MSKHFNRIGLVGHPRHKDGMQTHATLYDCLTDAGYTVIIEEDIAEHIDVPTAQKSLLNEMGNKVDLVIVVGGDGNMLRAARVFAQYDVKVIGVNRGTLGFLTDILPENITHQLPQVLAGEYLEDDRFLLEAQILQDGRLISSSLAMNEVVLHPGMVAHMIDFDVYINGAHAFSQRSDGLIIATPTGSTAYALSAGGAILEPSLDAIALVPMFPHSLSARPLVINSDSIIQVRFKDINDVFEVTCDSQTPLQIGQWSEVVIKRSPNLLQLIHPKDYTYFKTLATKLGWSKKLT